MRRVRASLLLRLAILGASLAIFLGAWWLVDSIGFTMGTAILLLLLWFVGVEGGVLAHLIEKFAVRRARRLGLSEIDSVWFVDLDRRDQAVREAYERDMRDNPTLH